MLDVENRRDLPMPRWRAAFWNSDWPLILSQSSRLSSPPATSVRMPIPLSVSLPLMARLQSLGLLVAQLVSRHRELQVGVVVFLHQLADRLLHRSTEAVLVLVRAGQERSDAFFSEARNNSLSSSTYLSMIVRGG